MEWYLNALGFRYTEDAEEVTTLWSNFWSKIHASFESFMVPLMVVGLPIAVLAIVIVFFVGVLRTEEDVTLTEIIALGFGIFCALPDAFLIMDRINTTSNVPLGEFILALIITDFFLLIPVWIACPIRFIINRENEEQ